MRNSSDDELAHDGPIGTNNYATLGVYPRKRLLSILSNINPDLINGLRLAGLGGELKSIEMLVCVCGHSFTI